MLKLYTSVRTAEKSTNHENQNEKTKNKKINRVSDAELLIASRNAQRLAPRVGVAANGMDLSKLEEASCWVYTPAVYQRTFLSSRNEFEVVRRQ